MKTHQGWDIVATWCTGDGLVPDKYYKHRHELGHILITLLRSSVTMNHSMQRIDKLLREMNDLFLSDNEEFNENTDLFINLISVLDNDHLKNISKLVLNLTDKLFNDVVQNTSRLIKLVSYSHSLELDLIVGKRISKLKNNEIPSEKLARTILELSLRRKLINKGIRNLFDDAIRLYLTRPRCLSLILSLHQIAPEYYEISHDDVIRLSESSLVDSGQKLLVGRLLEDIGRLDTALHYFNRSYFEADLSQEEVFTLFEAFQRAQKHDMAEQCIRRLIKEKAVSLPIIRELFRYRQKEFVADALLEIINARLHGAILDENSKRELLLFQLEFLYSKGKVLECIDLVINHDLSEHIKPELLILLIEAMYERGMLVESEKCMLILESKTTEFNARYYVLRAQRMIDAGEVANAADMLREHFNTCADDTDYLLVMALCHHMEGQWNELGKILYNSQFPPQYRYAYEIIAMEHHGKLDQVSALFTPSLLRAIMTNKRCGDYLMPRVLWSGLYSLSSKNMWNDVESILHETSDIATQDEKPRSIVDFYFNLAVCRKLVRDGELEPHYKSILHSIELMLSHERSPKELILIIRLLKDLSEYQYIAERVLFEDTRLITLYIVGKKVEKALIRIQERDVPKAEAIRKTLANLELHNAIGALRDAFLIHN